MALTSGQERLPGLELKNSGDKVSNKLRWPSQAPPLRRVIGIEMSILEVLSTGIDIGHSRSLG